MASSLSRKRGRNFPRYAQGKWLAAGEPTLLLKVPLLAIGTLGSNPSFFVFIYPRMIALAWEQSIEEQSATSSKIKHLSSQPPQKKVYLRQRSPWLKERSFRQYAQSRDGCHGSSLSQLRKDIPSLWLFGNTLVSKLSTYSSKGASIYNMTYTFFEIKGVLRSLRRRIYSRPCASLGIICCQSTRESIKMTQYSVPIFLILPNGETVICSIPNSRG